MVPKYRKITQPKNLQYDTRPDGTLRCGPGCFSSANILKFRFPSKKKAEASLTAPGRKNQHAYSCEYCGGFHLTSKKQP